MKTIFVILDENCPKTSVPQLKRNKLSPPKNKPANPLEFVRKRMKNREQKWVCFFIDEIKFFIFRKVVSQRCETCISIFQEIFTRIVSDV